MGKCLPFRTAPPPISENFPSLHSASKSQAVNSELSHLDVTIKTTIFMLSFSDYPSRSFQLISICTLHNYESIKLEMRGREGTLTPNLLWFAHDPQITWKPTKRNFNVKQDLLN